MLSAVMVDSTRCADSISTGRGGTASVRRWRRGGSAVTCPSLRQERAVRHPNGDRSTGDCGEMSNAATSTRSFGERPSSVPVARSNEHETMEQTRSGKVTSAWDGAEGMLVETVERTVMVCAVRNGWKSNGVR